jgi:predicted O-linked N-acetylglucosamine transferase (SPINDLY family)
LPILAPTHLLPMAARVSASLLRTVGLELLVARSLDEYEALAVALVNKPLALLQVWQHLRRVRWSSPLFYTLTYADVC